MENVDIFGGMGITGILAGFAGFIVLFVIWTVVWKALALWHAARRGEKGWYIALLLINTIGILEIIYLFAVVKIHKHSSSTGTTPTTTPKV